MKKLLTMLIIMIPALSFAQPKWSAKGEVRSVYSHNEYHIVETSVPDNSCGAAGKYWWPASDADAKDMLSIALTAFTARKKVHFVYNEGSPDCKWNGDYATHMGITE